MHSLSRVLLWNCICTMFCMVSSQMISLLEIGFTSLSRWETQECLGLGPRVLLTGELFSSPS